jgi:hypothetical protein
MSLSRNALAQGLINLSNQKPADLFHSGSNLTYADRLLLADAAEALRAAGCSCKMRKQETGPDKCKWCCQERYPLDLSPHEDEDVAPTPADDNERRRLESVIATLEDNYSWNESHKQDKLDALREVVLHLLGK